MTDNVVTVSGFAKRFGNAIAVDRIDFSLGRGEILALLGPNGAGKTSKLECIGGLRRADEGAIEVLGLDPIADSRELSRRVERPSLEERFLEIVRRRLHERLRLPHRLGVQGGNPRPEPPLHELPLSPRLLPSHAMRAFEGGTQGLISGAVLVAGGLISYGLATALYEWDGQNSSAAGRREAKARNLLALIAPRPTP